MTLCQSNLLLRRDPIHPVAQREREDQRLNFMRCEWAISQGYIRLGQIVWSKSRVSKRRHVGYVAFKLKTS